MLSSLTMMGSGSPLAVNKKYMLQFACTLYIHLKKGSYQIFLSGLLLPFPISLLNKILIQIKAIWLALVQYFMKNAVKSGYECHTCLTTISTSSKPVVL